MTHFNLNLQLALINTYLKYFVYVFNSTLYTLIYIILALNYKNIINTAAIEFLIQLLRDVTYLSLSLSLSSD